MPMECTTPDENGAICENCKKCHEISMQLYEYIINHCEKEGLSAEQAAQTATWTALTVVEALAGKGNEVSAAIYVAQIVNQWTEDIIALERETTQASRQSELQKSNNVANRMSGNKTLN